jgi:hypothetical protein
MSQYRLEQFDILERVCLLLLRAVSGVEVKDDESAMLRFDSKALATLSLNADPQEARLIGELIVAAQRRLPR